MTVLERWNVLASLTVIGNPCYVNQLVLSQDTLIALRAFVLVIFCCLGGLA